MNIGIIGAGNMGSAFARRLAGAGHRITITARESQRAEEVAGSVGNGARAVSADSVADDAEVLILATPYASAADALRTAGNARGKVVIDITNPLNADMSGLVVGFATSAAEEIQKAVPEARVVKAFNTVFAQILGGSARAQVFYAGDDAAAKRTVQTLVESAGLEPVDAGPLANARYLEPLGMLNIYFGYMGGRGTTVAPALVQVA